MSGPWGYRGQVTGSDMCRGHLAGCPLQRKKRNFVKKGPAGKNQGILKKWVKSGNFAKTCQGNIRKYQKFSPVS